MTFDEWNKAETRRLCEGEDRDTARNIRAARATGFAPFQFWDDYVAACAEAGLTPEPGPGPTL